MRIELTRPIQAHGQEVTALELREPTAGDIMECGYPLAIGDGEAKPQADVVGRLIARLAGVPPSAVKAMSMADFQTAMGVILGFFGDSGPAS